MKSLITTWLLFKAPWRVLFRWLAWPDRKLGEAQMRYLFPNDFDAFVRSTSSRRPGGSGG